MSRSSIWKACVVFSGLVVTGAARADDLERYKAENEIKAQKLIGEVKAALSQSIAQERSDPVKARDLLRKVQGRLEDDLVLPEKQRTALLGQVHNRLRVVLLAARAREAEDEARSEKAAVRVRQIQKRDGETQPPRDRNPADVARDFYDSGRNSVDAQRRLKYQRDKAVTGTLRELDESLTEGMTEQRITKRFLWATAHRVKKLSDKEQTLLKALNSVMSVDFTNSPFREVIDYLQERTGQAILLDDGSLKDANVEKDDPVTFKANKITVRTILRKLLQDKGLTYVIQEGTIQVVTPQKARDMMVVRSYPVGDLVTPIAQTGAPLFDLLWTQQNAQILIDQIKTTVDPSIWREGATITYNPVTRSLVIRAPAELHYSLGFGAGFGR